MLEVSLPPVSRAPRYLRLVRALAAAALHGVAWPSVRTAEFAAACTRRLPRWLWRKHPVVQARRRGLEFRLDLRDNVQRTLYFTNWYERRYLTLVERELRDGDVFVDVGAHIGIHSLLLGRRLLELGGRVFAFEPSPDLAHGIAAAADRNGLTNVTVVATGLGHDDGQVELRSDPEQWDEGDAAVASIVGPGPVVVRARSQSFDRWREREGLPRVDVVKIDVEGAETQVLQGMSGTLATLRPRLIGIEIRDYILQRAGTSEAALREILERAGYHEIPTNDLEGNILFAAST